MTSKVLSIIGIVLVLILSLSVIVYIVDGKVSDYVLERTQIYIPSGVANKQHHDVFSIDSYDYWIFKLSGAEIDKMNDDLKNDAWVKMQVSNIFYYDMLYCFDMSKYFSIVNKKSDLKDECYLCVYDLYNKRVITNEENSSVSDWAVFIYDKTNGYYYCFHESI